MNILATADVPPRSSIILESFMVRILGTPKSPCQGTPKPLNVRLAYMKTWNERLKFSREARGYNKIELARGVGVSSPTVTDWESGEIKKLEGVNLLKVCDFLKISPRWLLLDEGCMDEIVLSEYDLRAVTLNRALGVKERNAWYAVGESLSEQTEGANNKQ
jgi:transcriptional regulator with XRE-family HTH domain